MKDDAISGTITRRQLLTRIGMSAGAAMMYQSMAALGATQESSYRGPVALSGAPRGTSILILGAGMAGLVAAYELKQAGYNVKVLEYNQRAGGRSWTLRGGDEYTELGGFKQRCEFDPGLYINPGPWRLPYHHYGMLDYAKRLNVPLEAFNGLNFNAYLHSSRAFGGKPQRYRHVRTDYCGHVAEMLAKATNQGALDQSVTKEDKEKLLESLRHWGRLDQQFRYGASEKSSNTRGYEIDPGGGLMAKPVPSTPIAMNDLLDSGLWNFLASDFDYDINPSLFQPVGGMDRIANALYQKVAAEVQFGAKVVGIDQDARGVTVRYVDGKSGGAVQTAKADWCICTIPLSILAKIDMQVSPKMRAAIEAPSYLGSVKIGLQFKRKFWEEDERIYGGITYTDLPIQQIAYPNHGMNQPGKGVLLGAYVWDVNSFEFTAMSPQDRVRKAVEFGAQIHPQYTKEFENGISVAWHRSPFTQGCFALWPEDLREKHYDNLCPIDGRVALAGEHASRLPAWQEGAVLSSLDTIERLHRRITTHA
ncbi:MAG: flavin monoamine oxidase family protein [Rudaea sp.]